MIEYNINGVSNRVLIGQRGDLAQYCHDSDRWRAVWSKEIEKTIDQIGFAPRTVLDIGSGLGMLDIELIRRYEAHCTLIDGEDMNGECFKHNEPFCSRQLVQDFFAANLVPPEAWVYLSPPQCVDGYGWETYDLVVSTRSWCFHFAPETYMQWVRERVRVGSVVLIDVRRAHTNWMAELAELWPDNEVVEQGDKHDRIRFEVTA